VFGDTAMLDAFRQSVAALDADLVPVDISALTEAGVLLYAGPWIAERLSGLEDFVTVKPDALLPLTRHILEQGRRPSALDAFRALHRLRELQAELAVIWRTVDAIALPTIGTTFTFTDVENDPLGCNTALGRFTQFANLLDCAVLAVPAGCTTDGRPASLSLAGPAFSEERLAALATGSPAVQPAVEATVALAVVGLHLSGQPRNGDLLDCAATLRETTTTSANYRLYRLGGSHPVVPGLVRVPTAGAHIEVEIWDVPVVALGRLLHAVAAPLGLGHVRLRDGREVLGFLAEAYAAESAEDITTFGGWRAATASTPAPTDEEQRRS
jgi:allophanate hydrolase